LGGGHNLLRLHGHNLLRLILTVYFDEPLVGWAPYLL